jgi:hypothetical protein
MSTQASNDEKNYEKLIIQAFFAKVAQIVLQSRLPIFSIKSSNPNKWVRELVENAFLLRQNFFVSRLN